MTEYRDRTNNGSKIVNDIEFAAEILTCGHWPFQDAPKCVIPENMDRVKSHF